jgi:hypothetical protein
MADQGRLDLADARFESSRGFGSLRRLLCVGNVQVLSDLHRSKKKECSSCGPRRIWFYPTLSSRIPTSGMRSFPQYL